MAFRLDSAHDWTAWHLRARSLHPCIRQALQQSLHLALQPKWVSEQQARLCITVVGWVLVTKAYCAQELFVIIGALPPAPGRVDVLQGCAQPAVHVDQFAHGGGLR
jgi:hypothetical protein